MTSPHLSPAGAPHSDDAHLRLVWPQWQGAGTSSVQAFASEFPLEIAHRGYAVGTTVLDAILPPHEGPTATVPVTMSDHGLAERDGIEAKTVVVEQLARAVELVREHEPARITTLGGECAVSVAPFAALAHRYGDDLAVVWIDSHPDSEYPRQRVPRLSRHGRCRADRPRCSRGAAVAARDRAAGAVRPGRTALLDRRRRRQRRRMGRHLVQPRRAPRLHPAVAGLDRDHRLLARGRDFDVDTVDSNEVTLGLGAVPGGLSSTEVRRIVADINDSADVVGLTIAEFLPRQVMHLQQVLDGFPLLP
ncbi:arginase family protein [Bounagaea algeriensis]